MPISNEIRRLSAKWGTGSGWPKRLEWIEIEGLRGWTGQRFELRYPIMAVVGENGSGKSTILQAAAAVYKHQKGKFAGDYFPDTFWEKIRNSEIRYSIREGSGPAKLNSLRKPGERWRGNPERPGRHTDYRGLDRIQPVPSRVGYTRLVKAHHKEVTATLFDKVRLDRFSEIMGRPYDLAKMALTDTDSRRPVPVLSQQGTAYSCFHQGAGETTVAELLELDLPKYSLLLIDEIESSLHPRVQRRLVRDFAEKCREREWQVILTTHSPYVLSELPPEARAHIMQVGNAREIVYGVSPEFAMTRMDDVPHPECDLYVEDSRAQTMLTELLVTFLPTLGQRRCRIIPYGAASVGQALGQMVVNKRFPWPSRVFLDGDQAASPGCINLPGDDSPERVVFGTLSQKNWLNVHTRVGRAFADVADFCARAMTRTDEHEWIQDAASNLNLQGDILWQAMCSEWASTIDEATAKTITRPVEDALIGLADPYAMPVQPAHVSVTAPFSPEPKPLPPVKKKKSSGGARPSEPGLLFDQLLPVPEE